MLLAALALTSSLMPSASFQAPLIHASQPPLASTQEPSLVGQFLPDKLPDKKTAFPQPFAKGAQKKQFVIRGTKGWGWTPEQYMETIPTLVKGRMNFLMNCYVSMFTDPEKWINNWWEPIPEAKKRGFERVVRECQKRHIQFCFAIHPQLGTKRPFDFNSEKDFADLWQHYSWMQSLGVQWFSVSLDDIAVNRAGINYSGANHAKLVNRLFSKLREKDPNAQMVFCPTCYWGDGTAPDQRPYLESLAKDLHPDVYVFWTGDAVYTAKVTRKAAETYKGIVKHRLVLWDNFPVNDRNPALHLGPVVGRDKDLCEVIDGYMSNPMARETTLNTLPLLTCADYAFNPYAYDPARSIGQAVLWLGKTAEQRQLLLELVKLFPGPLVRGMEGSQYNWPLEDLRSMKSAAEAKALLSRVEQALSGLEGLYPDAMLAEKATLRRELDALKQGVREKFGVVGG